MLNAIIREKRQKKWKSAQRYRKAMERKRRLEKELGKLEERLKPDFEHNVKGILIAVLRCSYQSYCLLIHIPPISYL